MDGRRHTTNGSQCLAFRKGKRLRLDYIHFGAQYPIKIPTKLESQSTALLQSDMIRALAWVTMQCNYLMFIPYLTCLQDMEDNDVPIC